MNSFNMTFWNAIMDHCTPSGRDDPAFNYGFPPIMRVVEVFDPTKWPQPVNDNAPTSSVS